MSTLRPPIEVMLARAVDSVPTAFALPGGVQYEQKWDGYRLVVFSAPRPYLQSRRGADLTDAFPEVAAAVGALPDVVVDGELVIWGDGGLDFPALLQRMASKGAKARQLATDRPANFVVFDLLAADGDDLRREPLRVRRRRLEEVLSGVDPPLVVSPATNDREQAQEWLATYAAADVGIEGIVAKGLAQPYRGGPGTGSSTATETPSMSSSAPSPAASPDLSGSSSASTTMTPCTSSVAPPHCRLPNNGSSRRCSLLRPGAIRGPR